LKEAVEAFLGLVRVDKDDLSIATINTEASIDPDSIVDCCRIAHYLQCTQLLDLTPVTKHQPKQLTKYVPEHVPEYVAEHVAEYFS
jgi:hypothetical protein